MFLIDYVLKLEKLKLNFFFLIFFSDAAFATARRQGPRDLPFQVKQQKLVLRNLFYSIAKKFQLFGILSSIQGQS